MSFFTYKGYPLVRKDKELYFGNMYDEYVVWMQIQETRKLQDLDVASKIKIYLMRTDEKLNPMEAIVKTGERESLYDALAGSGRAGNSLIKAALHWLRRAADEAAGRILRLFWERGNFFGKPLAFLEWVWYNDYKSGQLCYAYGSGE